MILPIQYIYIMFANKHICSLIGIANKQVYLSHELDEIVNFQVT